MSTRVTGEVDGCCNSGERDGTHHSLRQAPGNHSGTHPVGARCKEADWSTGFVEYGKEPTPALISAAIALASEQRLENIETEESGENCEIQTATRSEWSAVSRR